jgi:hypothetical protein
VFVEAGPASPDRASFVSFIDEIDPPPRLAPEYSDTCASGSRSGCRLGGFREEGRQRVNPASGAVVKSIWGGAKFQGVPFIFCAHFLPSLGPKNPMVSKKERLDPAPSLLIRTERILSSLVLWIS